MSTPLTRVQLENLIQAVTITATGLPGSQVRIAYSSDGQPAWEIDQDIVAITISPIENPYDKQWDVTFSQLDADNATKSVSYTRVMQVLWTVYGPDSSDLADTIRMSIISESIRGTLAASGVYPMPAPPQVVRLPYNFNGQWWERCDAKYFMNVATERTYTVPYFKAAEIYLYEDTGLARTITLQQFNLDFQIPTSSQYLPLL